MLVGVWAVGQGSGPYHSFFSPADYPSRQSQGNLWSIGLAWGFRNLGARDKPKVGGRGADQGRPEPLHEHPSSAAPSDYFPPFSLRALGPGERGLVPPDGQWGRRGPGLPDAACRSHGIHPLGYPFYWPCVLYWSVAVCCVTGDVGRVCWGHYESLGLFCLERVWKVGSWRLGPWASFSPSMGTLSCDKWMCWNERKQTQLDSRDWFIWCLFMSFLLDCRLIHARIFSSPQTDRAMIFSTILLGSSFSIFLGLAIAGRCAIWLFPKRTWLMWNAPRCVAQNHQNIEIHLVYQHHSAPWFAICFQTVPYLNS